jgi:CheY-like chemotaxis protein
VSARAERSPLILAADGVPANAAALERQLAAPGHRVITASDRPAARAGCRFRVLLPVAAS